MIDHPRPCPECGNSFPVAMTCSLNPGRHNWPDPPAPPLKVRRAERAHFTVAAAIIRFGVSEPVANLVAARLSCELSRDLERDLKGHVCFQFTDEGSIEQATENIRAFNSALRKAFPWLGD